MISDMGKSEFSRPLKVSREGQVMVKFLPAELRGLIAQIPGDLITEIRLREGERTVVFERRGKGAARKVLGYVPTKEEIERIVMRLCEYSLYRAEDTLKQGFVTSAEGERVGICGSVTEGNNGVVFTRFTSLCIRFPHDVQGCASGFFEEYYRKREGNCLVVSPPYHGKTTFIRDLGRTISDELKKNVLFLDERAELSANGTFRLGRNSDVLTGACKAFGFGNGIRVLRPDVIVCDEIMGKTDVEAIAFAARSGVTVVASVHALTKEDLFGKEGIGRAAENGLFRYLIFLKNGEVGEVKTMCGKSFSAESR